MLRYIVKKVAQLAVVLVLISFLSFAVVYFAPGDISQMYITVDMTEEQQAAVRESLGLDKSLPEQYLAWASMVLQGDLGVSLSNSNMPVATLIGNRLPATLLLMGCSLGLALVLAVPLGLWAGYRRNSKVDAVISAVSYVGMSIPSFWFGMVLIILFAGVLHVLPSSGMHTVGAEGPVDTLRHLVMPVLALAIGDVAVYIRYVRANTIGQLGEEYVVAAEARGTPRVKILFKHVLKNTLLPVITLLGMNLSSLVCGSFIIETVFGWPGVGTLAMDAIGTRDYTVIMAYIMLSGTILVVGNFVADILYAVVDPRIKLFPSGPPGGRTDKDIHHDDSDIDGGPAALAGTAAPSAPRPQREGVREARAQG